MRLEPDSAWEEVERRIALAELAGPLTLGAEALSRLSSISRRRTYAAGSTIADRDQPVSSIQLLLRGDLCVERRGRVWRQLAKEGQPEEGNPLMLMWLARDPQRRVVSTEQGADVLELPVDGLEAIVEDDLWTPIARRLATRALELPSALVRCESCAGHELDDRLGALMRAMPFAARYIDALLQLDEGADLVRVDGKPWREGEPATVLYVPLEAGVPQLERDRLLGLGAIELLAGQPRTATLPAYGPYDALRIDEEALFDVLEDHPELARDLLAAIASFVLRGLEERTEPTV